MRKLWLGVVVCAYAGLAACTSLQPISGQPLPLGMMLSLAINDAGRVGLTDQMGQSITIVEGRLVQRDTAGYLLAVAQVETFRGGTQVWSGEHVRIKDEFVSVAREKKFSRAKTAIVSAAAIGLVAILASQGLLGNGSPETKPVVPDTALTTKIPHFIRH
ncbi:MAG: hypothetical protein ABJB66_04475 [Gemmatimonadaceae bacterium]